MLKSLTVSHYDLGDYVGSVGVDIDTWMSFGLVGLFDDSGGCNGIWDLLK